VAGAAGDGLDVFHPVTAAWFRAVFDAPTQPQRLGWPVIARGESALILAPTGTGKTLTAFLWCLDRLMLGQGSGFRGQGSERQGIGKREEGERNERLATAGLGTRDSGAAREACRVVYVSPLKALAVDVERNLRSPLAGMANMARRMGVPFREATIHVRTGDTPHRERARFARHPADILITTPESLYLLLTSQASEALRSVDTVIIDEIHALVPTKRGAHMALTLERLEALTGRRLQRIGLSATQRPLEEVARFLGGVEVEGSGFRVQGSEKQGTGNREQGTGTESEILDSVSNIVDSHPSDKNIDVARVGHPALQEQTTAGPSTTVAAATSAQDDRLLFELKKVDSRSLITTDSCDASFGLRTLIQRSSGFVTRQGFVMG